MSKNEDNRMACYGELKAYIVEHGHQPNHHKPENRNLHFWARYQCKRIKAGTNVEGTEEVVPCFDGVEEYGAYWGTKEKGFESLGFRN